MKRILSFIFIILVNLGFAQVGAKYLIITHDNFSGAIQPLAQWKQKKGLQTKVVKLSDIGATPESLARIKNYIVNAYNTWNPRPEYILLVGSGNYLRADNNMYDDYYANISGNYLMELPIGRMPCSTATQCSVMVTKTLSYEQTPYLVDTLWYKKGTGIIREDGTPAPDTVYWNNMRYIWGFWQNFGYTRIDSFSRLANDSARHVEAAITDGRAFVVFRGQGVVNWWAPFAVDPSRMNNGFKLPIVVSGTCATISLSPGPSYLGENFVRTGSVSNLKGAVAFLGTTNATSGPGIAEMRGIVTTNFFKTVFTDNIYKLGDAMKRAKFFIDSIHPAYYTSTFYREWNLLGDPELNVYTRVPKTISVVYDTVVPLNATNITVTVTSNGTPVANALVCLARDTIFYQTGTTGSNGVKSFTVTLPGTGIITVTVTGQNLKPFEGTIRVRTAGVEETGNPLSADRMPHKIIPNPCHNFAEISLTNPNSQTLNPQILIYDIQGRKVDSKILRLQDSKIRVDLRDIPNGVYMVFNKNEILGKIVKQ